MRKPLLQRLFSEAARIGGETFAVRYPDGAAELYGAPAEPRFTLVLRDTSFLSLGGDFALRFGEAFVDGAVDVEGDVADLLALTFRTAAALEEHLPAWVVKTMEGSARAPLRRRTNDRQRDDVVHHYDLGNDFFRLWLDDSLTYSCAYFRSDADTLEEAQRAKVDHTLAKLRLRSGDSLLDIGCGWGALVMRAAEAHGARAVGITLSDEQFQAACDAIKSRGLEDRATVRVAHYEQLARERPGQFDKIASIGMAEHVGKAHLGEYAAAVKTLLRPGGLALVHLITSVNEGSLNAWSDRYIFPGAYIPTLPEMLGHLNREKLHVWDVENLGPHYRRTLDLWSDRFEQSVPQIQERYGEPFVRMWRLYLRGTSACFRIGILEIHQILVSNGLPDPPLPLTRSDLYGTSGRFPP